ncbi:ABC transporter ATP-binding protein [soil metagenome]
MSAKTNKGAAPDTPGSRARAASEAKLRAFHEEDAVGKVYDFRLARRLWPFVKPHAKFLWVSLGLLLVLTALKLMIPRVMGDVIRQIDARDMSAFKRDGVILTVVVISIQLFTFVQVYAMQIAGARAMADLRDRIFVFLQGLSLRFFDRTPVGRLVTRVTNDVDAVAELFAQGVLNAFGDLLTLFGIVIAMVIIDWRMSLIAFAALPIVALIVNAVRKRSREAFRDIRTKTARLNAFLNEQVSGVAVVQAYAREASVAREFDEINDAYRDANKRSIYYEAILDAAIEMVATLCIGSVLFYVGIRRHSGGETFALVVTFAGYIKQFFEPISILSQRYTVLQSALTGAERIFQLLDETDREEDVAAVDCAPDLGGGEGISLEHVTFGYKPNAPVLRDVTITAKRGEKIALVGATGSGKTTIGSLLLRLYEVKSGVVRINGRDVRRYDRQDLRELFAVVPQDVFLFSGTLLSNVAMSDEKADRERAKRAFERIGAREIFARRGEGVDGDFLDSRVDERGQNFSAGERQLIAFARALYRDAPFLLLDEATASVDSATEARLQIALDAVLEGRTAVVIAHRLSTIKAVDRIVVLHKGRVVEQGPHDELLAQDGVYAKLYRLQLARELAK